MRIFVLAVMMSIAGSSLAGAQSFTPDESDKRERQYFDFLIGEWKIVQKETADGVMSGGEDTYIFREALDGNAIISEWYFNRGTKSNPNFTEGLYYSAYDNLTDAWSFYYISAASAQYYQGKKEKGQWYFHRKFTIEGNTFHQRQSWKMKNDSILIRTIENSADEEKTWEKVVVTIMKKSE